MQDNSVIFYLVLYVFWIVVLVLSFGLQRVFLVLTGQKTAHDFPAGVPHGAPLYWRMNRAHGNAIENFQIYAALILAGLFVGVGGDPTFKTLALVTLVARILQSIFHWLSYRGLWVNFRFTFFIVQMVCYLAMGFQILRMIRVS